MATAMAASSQVCDFVSKHSELYKEQKIGDAEATAEGCFPPAVMMESERVVTCLGVLEGLFEERKAELSSKKRRGHRVFLVRYGPLYASLEGWDNAECMADLKTVTDYMLLPKCLNEALELEGAVVKARREYQAAIGSYNLLTATSPKPRLFDFLVRDDGLKELLRGLGTQHAALAAIMPRNPKNYYRKSAADDPGDSILHMGMLDGLMGESLSEYGYTPSARRVLAYTSGCILAQQRPIPVSSLPAPSKSAHSILPLLMAASNPLRLAAEIGNVAALQQLHACGWRVTSDRNLLELAGGSGCRETLTWLCSLAADWDLSTAFHAAVIAGHFDTAKWMLDTLGARLGVELGKVDGSAMTFRAAQHNNLEALKWLHLELGFKLSSHILEWACKHGNREMLDWYLSKSEEAPERGPLWGWSEVCAGLHAGHLDITLSLLERGRPADKLSSKTNMFASACAGLKGDTSVLDLIMTLGPELPEPYDTNGSISWLALHAAKLGYPQVLEWITKLPRFEGWFLDPNARETRKALEHAVTSAQTESVRWLLTRSVTLRRAGAGASDEGKPYPISVDMYLPGSPLPSQELLELLAPYYDLSCFYCAAINAMDVDLARRLKGLGASFELNRINGEALLEVLESGGPGDHPRLLELVRCLVEECGLDFRVLGVVGCSVAVARGGSVELLEFLVANGCDLSSDALLEAARHGQLPMCRWLRQQGVTWPEYLLAKARSSGADEVAAWAKQEQARESLASSSAAGAAAATT